MRSKRNIGGIFLKAPKPGPRIVSIVPTAYSRVLLGKEGISHGRLLQVVYNYSTRMWEYNISRIRPDGTISHHSGLTQEFSTFALAAGLLQRVVDTHTSHEWFTVQAEGNRLAQSSDAGGSREHTGTAMAMLQALDARDSVENPNSGGVQNIEGYLQEGIDIATRQDDI